MLEDYLLAANRLVSSRPMDVLHRRKTFWVYGGFAEAINV